MRLMRRSTLLVLILSLTIAMILTSATSAQKLNRVGKIGLSAAVQGEQMDVLVPIWASQNLALVPSVGFASASDAAKDLRLGLGIRGALRSGKLAPYVGARFQMFALMPDNGTTRTDWVVGPMFGGEYFFEEHFSVGVEAQLNIAFSDKYSLRFGNPDGTDVNTATTVMATFYF